MYSYDQLHENMEKCKKMIRNDCSTGYDHIPASFVKPVSELLVSPITFIICRRFHNLS